MSHPFAFLVFMFIKLDNFQRKVINTLGPVADRGVSEPWGPQFCGALCNGETQRLPLEALEAPRWGPRQSPGGKHILATI